jgi:glutamine synthetase
MSLFRDGRNVFYDPEGPKQLSAEARHFIAGQLEHIRGMCAVLNPLVNSYKRLVPGYEAPCYVAWSASNRSALVRIPSARGQSTRAELRSPDPSCNPYLALALCLTAGLDGMEKGLEPPAEITENIYAMRREDRKKHGIRNLPGTLNEALEALRADPVLMEALGEHVFTQYTEGKQREWEQYRSRVSNWELERYMIRY